MLESVAAGAGPAATAAAQGATATSPISVAATGNGPPEDATATMRRLPDEATPIAPPVEPHAPAPTPPIEATWVVEPGQSFWFAAASVLEGAWGRHASPPEVLDYWHKVVDRNRSTLADPDNPDLVFAGQTFALPPPPAAPED